MVCRLRAPRSAAMDQVCGSTAPALALCKSAISDAGAGKAAGKFLFREIKSSDEVEMDCTSSLDCTYFSLQKSTSANNARPSCLLIAVTAECADGHLLATASQHAYGASEEPLLPVAWDLQREHPHWWHLCPSPLAGCLC